MWLSWCCDWIFWEKYVNAQAADALGPCVVSLSAFLFCSWSVNMFLFLISLSWRNTRKYTRKQSFCFNCEVKRFWGSLNNKKANIKINNVYRISNSKYVDYFTYSSIEITECLWCINGNAWGNSLFRAVPVSNAEIDVVCYFLLCSHI